MRNGHAWFCAALLASALSLTGLPAATAGHPDVTTLKSDGTSAGPSDAYSPKQTCGGCHFTCADRSYSSDRSTWCNGATTTPLKWNCSTAGNCPDYESQESKEITKSQGYGTSTGTTKFQNYVVKAPRHGASTGKHSTHGRNEEWTAALRTIWGAPGFTSSPGMSGRY